MKQIKKGELYRHLSDFLKKKGVELHKGPYPGRIEQVCHLLTETINATQSTLGRAREGMDRGLQQVRQALKTKPRGSAAKTSPSAAPPPGQSPPKPRTRAAKTDRRPPRRRDAKRKAKKQ